MFRLQTASKLCHPLSCNLLYFKSLAIPVYWPAGLDPSATLIFSQNLYFRQYISSLMLWDRGVQAGGASDRRSDLMRFFERGTVPS